MVFQFLINGIIIGSVYALISLGFALIYNTTRIFHIAYAVLYMIAPYFVYSFFSVIGLNFWLSIFLAIILTILISLFMELVVYKPLSKKKSSGNVILISSIGIMIVIINVIALFYGNDTKVLNRNVSDTIHWGHLIITHKQLWQLGVSVSLISVFMFFLRYSKFGLKTRAMRDSEVLCNVLSMNTYRFRNYLFMLSAVFAGTAGILIGWDLGMDPYIGMPMLLNAIVALIIGGIGTFYAPVFGGFIIGILQSLVIWQFSANWMEGVTFVLLILFLIFRPQGLFGEKQRIV